MSNIFKCGFCDFLCGLLRRVMCSRNRRGSSDSCYRELGGQNTVRMDSSHSSDATGRTAGRLTFEEELERILEENEKQLSTNRTHFGPFCTIKRQGPSYRNHQALDECYPKLTELLLSRTERWEFNTFHLDRATGGHCLISFGMHIFYKYNLFIHFKLEPENCLKLFRLIELNYGQNNPYHNALHACDVAQAVHCFIQQPALLPHLRKTEILAVLLAALTHDLDHPGFGKSYLIATKHPLVVMYKDLEMGKDDRSPLLRQKGGKLHHIFRRDRQDNTQDRRGRAASATEESGASSSTSFFRRKKKQVEGSILECHHWRVAYSCILQSQVFSHMTDRLPRIKRLLKELILATDISRQVDYLKAFKSFLTRKNLDMRLEEHRLMVLQIALKTADISNPGRPWSISRKWSLKVCDEFYNQGDKEREMNIPISLMCNREQDTIPDIQTGFIDYIVRPLYTEWHHYLRSDLSMKMMINLVHNAAEWGREAQRSKTSYKQMTPADEHPDSRSRNHSASTECLLQEAGASAPRAAPRRSSYSPARASIYKDALRRFSAPLHSVVGTPRLISEVRLREEVHHSSSGDCKPREARRTPRRSAEEIRASRTLPRLELAMAVAADRSRSQERSSSHLPPPHHPAGPTPLRASIPAPLPEFHLNGSPRCCAGFSAKDSDSNSNGVEKFHFGSFVLAECDYERCHTTSPSITTSTDPHLLSTITGSLTTPSSDSRNFFPLTLNNASACATTNCEAVDRRGGRLQYVALARLMPDLSRRRGSAPVGAALQPCPQTAHAEVNRLSASYAACQRIAEAAPPAPVRRRGSLPVEVMAGISAL